MYFYVVVFSKSMSCKYCHVRSNLLLIDFEYFLEKNLNAEVTKIPKANLKCTCRLTRLFNLDALIHLMLFNLDTVR